MAGPKAASAVDAAGPASSQVEEIYRALTARFERDAAAGGDVLRQGRFRLAGSNVLVRVLGDALAGQVLSAFATTRRGAEEGSPELRIDLFEAPPSESEIGGRGGGEPSGRFAGSPSGRYLLHEGRGFRGLLDRQGGHLVASISEAEWLAWERAKPLSSLLAVWFADRDVAFVHAGGVARGGRAALALGRGGSGKSTVALVCARAGFGFLGDDCVALSGDRGAFRAHAVYGTAALDEQHLLRVAAELAAGPVLARSDDGKRVFPVSDQASGMGDKDPALAALLIPTVVPDGLTALRAASPREALLAVAPSSVLGRAVPARETLARLAEVVETVPSYRIELGSELEALPGLVAETLEKGEAQ
jgi:hypothetical protein